jgi:hypothetical protein
MMLDWNAYPAELNARVKEMSKLAPNAVAGFSQSTRANIARASTSSEFCIQSDRRSRGSMPCRNTRSRHRRAPS